MMGKAKQQSETFERYSDVWSLVLLLRVFFYFREAAQAWLAVGLVCLFACIYVCLDLCREGWMGCI